VIENDDRSFDITDVAGLSRRIGVPVVWDALHHRCNDAERIPDREALALALSTWPEGAPPKVHFSSPRLDVGERSRRDGRRVIRTPTLPDLRQHADLIDPIAFETFALDALAGTHADVMLEAKAKDLAVLRLREQLADRGFGWERGSLQLPG
jgi:UV DNA damage endonuclease